MDRWLEEALQRMQAGMGEDIREQLRDHLRHGHFHYGGAAYDLRPPLVLTGPAETANQERPIQVPNLTDRPELEEETLIFFELLCPSSSSRATSLGCPEGFDAVAPLHQPPDGFCHVHQQTLIAEPRCPACRNKLGILESTGRFICPTCERTP